MGKNTGLISSFTETTLSIKATTKWITNTIFCACQFYIVRRGVVVVVLIVLCSLVDNSSHHHRSCFRFMRYNDRIIPVAFITQSRPHVFAQLWYYHYYYGFKEHKSTSFIWSLFRESSTNTFWDKKASACCSSLICIFIYYFFLCYKMLHKILQFLNNYSFKKPLTITNFSFYYSNNLLLEYLFYPLNI